MSTLGVVTKKPDDVLDYDVDFARWLAVGDRVISAATDITGGTAEIDNAETSETQVRVWVSGGAVGESATVRVTATTEQGRTKEVCFRLRVRGC